MFSLLIQPRSPDISVDSLFLLCSCISRPSFVNFPTGVGRYRINQWVLICLRKYMEKCYDIYTIREKSMLITFQLLSIFSLYTCWLCWWPLAVASFVCRATAAVLWNKNTALMWIKFCQNTLRYVDVSVTLLTVATTTRIFLEFLDWINKKGYNNQTCSQSST